MGQVLLRRGILGHRRNRLTWGYFAARHREAEASVFGKPEHLSGRVEFDYLPENAQGVICQPMGDRAVLILGANAPRSYTQQDEAWIAGIAEKVGDLLDRELERV